MACHPGASHRLSAQKRQPGRRSLLPETVITTVVTGITATPIQLAGLIRQPLLHSRLPFGA